MIVTRQPHIPFSWLLMTMVPWVFFYFLISVGGINLFVLNRLIDNPAALTFAIASIDMVYGPEKSGVPVLLGITAGRASK